MNNWLKNIIKDEIEIVLNSKFIHKLKNDIFYLKDFKPLSQDVEGDEKVFIFKNNTNYNISIFTAINKNNKWYCKIDFDGNLKNSTGGDFSWGPFESYRDFIFYVNKKLSNNPIFGTQNLSNKYLDPVDNEVIELSKRLLKVGDNLKFVPEGDLQDLKDVYRVLKSIGSNEIDDREIIETLRNRYNWKYSGLINTLSKTTQIDYYINLKNFKNIDHEKKFAGKK